MPPQSQGIDFEPRQTSSSCCGSAVSSGCVVDRLIGFFVRERSFRSSVGLCEEIFAVLILSEAGIQTVILLSIFVALLLCNLLRDLLTCARLLLKRACILVISLLERTQKSDSGYEKLI